MGEKIENPKSSAKPPGGEIQHRQSLWRQPDFVKLWAGQTISMVGSAITRLALPLTAVVTLGATPAQMGILTAAESLPSLVVGLLAGAWVDRLRRRPILIVTDIGRGLLLLLIPFLALAGWLRIEVIYIVAFLVGVLSLFFGTAYHAFLPALVGRAHLIEGNSKLELSRSAAEIAGPGLAGGLIQLVTAPVAILIDALSFLLSALILAFIRTPEPAPPPPTQTPNIWQEIGEGLRLVAGNPILRALAGCTGMAYFFNAVLEAVWILYLTQRLGISAGLLGFIFATGGLGFLVGALLPERLTHRFGLGTTLIGGLILTGVSDLLTPLATGSLLSISLILITGQFFFGIGLTLFNVGQVSLRQAVTPDPLQGRMNATMGFISWGLVPLGGLLGGWLGETIGLWATLVVGASGEILAVSWLWLSPVRRYKAEE